MDNEYVSNNQINSELLDVSCVVAFDRIKYIHIKANYGITFFLKTHQFKKLYFTKLLFKDICILF